MGSIAPVGWHFIAISTIPTQTGGAHRNCTIVFTLCATRESSPATSGLWSASAIERLFNQPVHIVFSAQISGQGDRSAAMTANFFGNRFSPHSVSGARLSKTLSERHSNRSADAFARSSDDSDTVFEAR